MPYSRPKFLFILSAFLVFFSLMGCSTTLKSGFTASTGSEQSLSDHFGSPIAQPAYFQKLQDQPYIAHGSRKIKAVALTFDADMTPYMLKLLQTKKVHSWYDARIVQTLRNDHVPATIFTTGMWAETYPQVIQSLARDPNFEIENHSYDHAAFTIPCYGLWIAQNPQQEIVQAQNVIMKIVGVEPKFFRFPGGCFQAKDLELVHSYGIIPIQWDVISGDSFLKNPHAVVQQVVSQAQNGSIIVFHLNGAPNAPATAFALPAIIQSLRAKGYGFMRLDQLLQASAKA